MAFSGGIDLRSEALKYIQQALDGAGGDPHVVAPYLWLAVAGVYAILYIGEAIRHEARLNREQRR